MKYDLEVKATMTLKWYQVPALWLLNISCLILGFKVKYGNSN